MLFYALSLDTRKHTHEYSIRFGSVRFGTKVTYDEKYPQIAKDLDVKTAAELAAAKVQFEKDLEPYTDVLELLASLQKSPDAEKKNKLNITLKSQHPELAEAYEEYTTNWVEPKGTLEKVKNLYQTVIEKVKGIHEILDNAGLAKPIEKAAES